MNIVIFMYKIIKLSIIIVAEFAYSSLLSQNIADTSLQIQGVCITSSRSEDFNIGKHCEIIDSITYQTFIGENISELLQKNSNVNLKNYGAGGIATASIRGASASHTSVLWNDIAIQSPMNGGADISLLPVRFFDNIALTYGGTGAVSGNGSVGGSINIDNKAAYNSGLYLTKSSHFNQLLDFITHGALSTGLRDYSAAIKAYYNSSKNNFAYKNYARIGYPEENLKHAETHILGVTIDQYLKISGKQELSLNLWYQESDRNIPPLMTENISYAKIYDESYRGILKWQYNGAKTIAQLKTAIINDLQHFTDSFPLIDSYNNFLNSITEFELKYSHKKKHLFDLCVNNTFEQASTNNYSGIKSRERMSLFTGYKYRSPDNSWNISLSVREEFSDKKFITPVPSAGAEGKIGKKTILKISGSRIFRLPTLNDMYWNPGGNTDLLPEFGWTEDAGIVQKINIKKTMSEMGITIYNSNISNWIIWLPEGNLWTPQNIMHVWSRGIETSAKTSFSVTNINFTINSRYNYTMSENYSLKMNNDASYGKQLIYTPMHQASINFTANFKQYLIVFNYSYSGKRYTSSDNSSFLPGFNTGDLRITRDFVFHNFAINISLGADNIWNEQYQHILWMPAPGRFYKASITTKFNHKFKHLTKFKK